MPPKQGQGLVPAHKNCLFKTENGIEAQGYHIEDCRECITSLAATKIEFDTTHNIPYFAKFLYGEPFVVHYGTGPTAGPVVVVSTPARDLEGVHRVMCWTPTETRRFTVPALPSWVDVLQEAYPALADVKFDTAPPGSSYVIQDDLLEFEQLSLVKAYKFAILYAAPGQTTEAEMLNNAAGSPNYDAFVNVLGNTVNLVNWESYRGGLSTAESAIDGERSVYTIYRDIEVMFHVATLMPLSPNDPKQINRKRHIGNDVVVVIFKERSDPLDAIDVTSFHTRFNRLLFLSSS